MATPRVRLVLLLLAAAYVCGVLTRPLGAQGCPAINFQTTPQIAPPNSSTDAIVVRQPDGSFTGYEIPFNSANATVIPNFQNQITACSLAPTGAGAKTMINFNPTGTPSEAGAIADLNGNGIPEVIIAQANGVGVGVTIYNDLNLQNATHYLQSIVPAGVSVADVDGDGHPDLVVVDGGNVSGPDQLGGIVILLNNGDGTFTKKGSTYPGNGPDTVAVADINGDGKPDVVAGNFGNNSLTSGTLLVMLGNGDGTFQSPTTIAAAGPVICVLIADFNKDGNPDLAVVTFSNGNQNTLQILLGNGKGGFSPQPSFLLTGPSTALTAGDFNGDGNLDLATGDYSHSTVSILLGKGNGTFQSGSVYAAPSPTEALTVTDYNNDGIADILIGTGGPTAIGEGEDSGVIGVLLGNGDGTFQGLHTTILKTSDNAAFVAAADFNGDGKVDAIVGEQLSDNLVFFAGNGDGTFKSPTSIATGHTNGPGVSGDFNGDGRPDLAVGALMGTTVSIYLNSGGGSFQTASSVSSGGTAPNGIVTADFNGDGKLDLAVANSGALASTGAGGAGNVAILNGGGNGSFSAATTYTAGTAPSAIAAGDLNGDGKPDLAVVDTGVNTGTPATSTGALYVLVNQGNGTFRTPVKYAVSSYPTAVAIGDVNGDGKLDVIVSTQDMNFNFTIAVLLGNGDGTLQAAKSVATDFGPTQLTIRDFNGDGKADIVIDHCCGSTNMGYFVGHGDGTFDPEVEFNGGASPQTFAVADINGDGKPDLLIGGTQPLSFSALLNLSSAAQSLSIASSAPAPTGSPVAPGSIASAFGSDLGTTANPGGTTVTVKDAVGNSQTATLFYVSPKQVNFLIPSGIATGLATVTVQSADGTTSTGTVQVASVAPGIYTLNAAGLVAAFALVVGADGSQNLENVYQVNSSNSVVALPVNVSSGQVYLEIYGTGVRNASNVTVTVGGQSVPVQSAGASGDPGEDQINILLPSSLQGSGSVPVVVTADGIAANTVYVTIQ
jgi:uncharacterized protein (TIGR03437 family)